MHYAKNMVGAVTANYNVPLLKRYFRLSKHRKPGRITKAFMATMIALELRAGVYSYG